MVRDVHLEERALDMEDSSGNDDLKYPGWQKPLLEAVLELDAHKSKARVAAAEITICNRLETLSPGHDHHAERQALDDALRTLRILKTYVELRLSHRVGYFFNSACLVPGAA